MHNITTINTNIPDFIKDLAKFRVAWNGPSLKDQDQSGFWSKDDDSVEIIILNNTITVFVNEQPKAVYYLELVEVNGNKIWPIYSLLKYERFSNNINGVYKGISSDVYLSKVNEFMDKWGRL